MEASLDWHLDPHAKEFRKLNDIMTSHARKLKKEIEEAESEEEKKNAVYTYYRKYYTLTLNKTSLTAGINRSPTRDIILDYPWKDLKMNRIVCLKIWEKINH